VAEGALAEAQGVVERAIENLSRRRSTNEPEQ
jgi:hypothetical protein